MAAILSAMAVLTLLSTLASSAPTTTSPPTTQDTYLFVPRQIPLGLLPQGSDVPSFPPSEPLAVLTPPLEAPGPDFYRVPIPSQELLAPTEIGWNPQNDPELYYQVIPARQERPTKAFPKKFLQEVHSKGKPYSSVPKQEVVLEEAPRKVLEKGILDEEKRRNREEIRKVAKRHREPVAESSGYEEGLSEDITASLGIPHSQARGERLNFHVVGHDGPKSYKWGYDTGKGHDRMFRFEERDNTGLVKGHYGFYDKGGKLQVVHYDAHPHTGFHSDADGSTN